MAEEVPLLVVGVDHHRTPLADRERLAVAGDALVTLEDALATLPGCTGAVVLSTCNRLECWLAGAPRSEAVVDCLARSRGLEAGRVAGWTASRSGGAALRHLFRVAGGLESLVVGEAQIQGQVRDAYDRARQRVELPGILHQAFQRALACGKRVRSETALGRLRESTASVAADLARQVVGDLARARVLVVGAGSIADEVLAVLAAAGVTAPTVVNRSRERAAAVATARGAVVADWNELPALLARHDIVVCSTASPEPVITAAMVRPALRGRRRGLVLIDLAVPRDVDPAVAGLDDAYLYNIDHLESVVVANRRLKVEEVDQAVALVDAAVDEAARCLRPDAGALPAAVAAWHDRVVAEEWERIRVRIPADLHEEVRYALSRVAARGQHRVQGFLRRDGDPGRAAAVRELFGLDDG